MTEKSFHVFIQETVKDYENIFLDSQDMNRNLRLSVSDTNHIPLNDKYRILKQIKLEDLKAFSKRYLQEFKIKAIMQGNLDADRAKQIMSDVKDLLTCGKIKNVSEIERGKP